MNGRVIRLRGISERDVGAWRDLAGRALEANALCEPECLIPASLHQANGAEISLLVAEDHGKFHACVPIRRLSRYWRIPFPTVSSTVRRMQYLGTPLVDLVRGEEAVRTLLATLVAGRSSSGPEFYALEWVQEGEVARHFRSAADELGLPLYVRESFERPFLVRDADSSEKNPKRERRALTRQRRLKRDLEAEIEFVDHRGDPDAVDRYIDLEASGYKSRIGLAEAAVGETDYFRAMCAEFAKQGRLHLPTLEADGQPLAMQVWLRSGPGMFLIKTSFDERWAHHSPGRILHHLGIGYFHTRTDADWLDTCTYENNEQMLRYYPDRRRISTFVIGLGGLLDGSVLRSVAVLHHARKLLRSRVPGMTTGKAVAA